MYHWITVGIVIKSDEMTTGWLKMVLRWSSATFLEECTVRNLQYPINSELTSYDNLFLVFKFEKLILISWFTSKLAIQESLTFS